MLFSPGRWLAKMMVLVDQHRLWMAQHVVDVGHHHDDQHGPVANLMWKDSEDGMQHLHVDAEC